LDLAITTPSGKTLTSSSPEVTAYYEGDTEEYYLVESAERGEWKVEVVGIDVDAGGEPYELSVIANERTQPPTADSDHDGLPDEWEENFYGDLSEDGAGDEDGDGMSNAQEFEQGTDPMIKEATTLTVRKAGRGTGAVWVGAQSCDAACAELTVPAAANSGLMLKAEAAAGSRFARWETAEGNVLTGQFDAALTASSTVIAVFERK